MASQRNGNCARVEKFNFLGFMKSAAFMIEIIAPSERLSRKFFLNLLPLSALCSCGFYCYPDFDNFLGIGNGVFCVSFTSKHIKVNLGICCQPPTFLRNCYPPIQNFLLHNPSRDAVLYCTSQDAQKKVSPPIMILDSVILLASQYAQYQNVTLNVTLSFVFFFITPPF